MTREKGGPRDLPPFVAIPDTPQVAGYLGVEFAPFSTTSVPKAGQPFTVRGITLRNGLTVEEVEKRRDLLRSLDTTFRGFEEQSDLIHGLDRFCQPRDGRWSDDRCSRSRHLRSPIAHRSCGSRS